MNYSAQYQHIPESAPLPYTNSLIVSHVKISPCMNSEESGQDYSRNIQIQQLNLTEKLFS